MWCVDTWNPKRINDGKGKRKEGIEGNERKPSGTNMYQKREEPFGTVGRNCNKREARKAENQNKKT